MSLANNRRGPVVSTGWEVGLGLDVGGREVVQTRPAGLGHNGDAGGEEGGYLAGVGRGGGGSERC